MEQLLLFGRELQTLFGQLNEGGSSPNPCLQTLLQDVFSLLAYTDPSTSPVAYLLDPAQRESVTSALNSAILGKREKEREKVYLRSFIVINGLPGKPPLELALGQATQCLHLMSQHGLGAAAFASVDDLLRPMLSHNQPCVP